MSEGKKMKIKKIFALFLCIVISASAMAGCGVSGSNLSGTVGNLKNDGVPMTTYSGLLGYGYDMINNAFFSPSYVDRNCVVFDTNKLLADKLIYRTRGDNQEEVHHITGTDSEAYTKDVSAQFKISASGTLFKGSVENTFSADESSSYSSTDSFITTIASKSVVDDYINLSSVDKMKEYLTDQFKQDINNENISPDTIISTYGTHVILNTLLGGRCEIRYKYHNYYQTNNKTLQDEAKAAYKDVKTSASGTYSTSTQKLLDNSDLDIKVYGGGGLNANSLADLQTSYQKWMDGITAKSEDLVFLGVEKMYKTPVDTSVSSSSSSSSDSNTALDNLNPQALVPIWEFANSPARQEKIRNAYKTLLQTTGSKFNGLQPIEYVKDIYFGNAKNTKEGAANAKSILQQTLSQNGSNENRVILDYDIANHTGGDFIYLGYLLTTNPNEALTDVKLDYRANSKQSQMNQSVSHAVNGNNVTYTRYNLDLTKGSGGSDYVVAYTTHDSNAGAPLKALGIEYGSNNYTFAQDGNMMGWTPVARFGETLGLDVTKGTGGSRNIYLWEKR